MKNPDGTPYKAVGSLQTFDPESQEKCLFNEWDAEMIQVYGSPLLYFEVFIQTGSLDRLYREDRGKIFSNDPITIFGMYEPIPSQNYQNAFGIDSPDEIIFECNYKDVVKRIKHPPKIGSRIHTPHKNEDWVIIQRNLGEFQIWGQVRMQILCQRFQESVTTGEGRVTQKKPDFDLNDIKKQ